MSKELYNKYSPWNQNDVEYGDDVYLSDGVYVTAEGEVYNTKAETLGKSCETKVLDTTDNSN